MAPEQNKIPQLVASVQAMLEAWPHGIDVYVDVLGQEVAMDAPAWIGAAAGQWLHGALGGEGVFVGTFVRAQRRLPTAEAGAC